MSLFPYPYGFCNTVQIHGKKINDDDAANDEHCVWVCMYNGGPFSAQPSGTYADSYHWILKAEICT